MLFCPFSATQDFSGTNTITEEHLRASLLSAVEDKMKRALRETFYQAQVLLMDSSPTYNHDHL